jgi:hypothetical protein
MLCTILWWMDKKYWTAIPPTAELVEVEVTLRPTVSRPVSLGVRRPSGTHNQFYFLLKIFFRHLRVCNFLAPSLTRGWVCNLLYNYFWALPEQSLLGRSPAELTAIFYCLIWDSPNLEGQVPVFISPRNRVAQLYPRALGSLFLSPLMTRRAAVELAVVVRHTASVYINCLRSMWSMSAKHGMACNRPMNFSACSVIQTTKLWGLNKK